MGIPPRDLELFTVGMITDMVIEAGNDAAEYDQIASEEDYEWL